MKVVDAIVAEQVNMALLVPTMIDFVDRTLQAKPADMSSLRKVIYGASPISEALLKRAMKSLPNARLYQGYGQTECAGGVVLSSPSSTLAGVRGDRHPSDKWGEEVHAIVRLRDGQTVGAEELTAHVGELIAGCKRPRSFTFRTDALPLSAVGKVLKVELRKPFWEGHSRRVG